MASASQLYVKHAVKASLVEYLDKYMMLMKVEVSEKTIMSMNQLVLLQVFYWRPYIMQDLQL